MYHCIFSVWFLAKDFEGRYRRGQNVELQNSRLPLWYPVLVRKHGPSRVDVSMGALQFVWRLIDRLRLTSSSCGTLCHWPWMARRWRPFSAQTQARWLLPLQPRPAYARIDAILKQWANFCALVIGFRKKTSGIFSLYIYNPPRRVPNPRRNLRPWVHLIPFFFPFSFFFLHLFGAADIYVQEIPSKWGILAIPVSTSLPVIQTISIWNVI